MGMPVIDSDMIFMCIDFYEPAYPNLQTIRDVISVGKWIFLIIYIVEMVLKWIGLGMKQYIKGPWNRLDFTLVMISLLDQIISNSGSSSPFRASMIRVLRLFRVMRILRV